MPAANGSPTNGRRLKTKSKSGCRTCKIRKVKCDEGRPACDRCISTGRVCDGYGIWGSGGNLYSQRQNQIVKDSDCIMQPSSSLSILPSGVDDKGYLEWFKLRTCIKIPGSFISKFWTKLLFQASMNDPAVLHAVLALSSVHKNGTVEGEGHNPTDGFPKKHEEFLLQNYVKSINHLRPHFSVKDKASSRIALITCIVFVYLEFLRGHFKTAQIHIQNGLNIIRDLEICPPCHNYALTYPSTSRESTDDWIVETFSRLHLQVELFRHSYAHPCQCLHVRDRKEQITEFHSVYHAWQEMERLMYTIFHLKNQAHQESRSHGGGRIRSSPTPALLKKHQRLQSDITQWLITYKTYIQTRQPGVHSPEDMEKVDNLLQAYHTMAHIMGLTCLYPDSETIYDAHTSSFALLIYQLIILWKHFEPMWLLMQDSPSMFSSTSAFGFYMPHSTIDIGWIPILYYAATRCRVHRIRVHAIRLLERTSHREGIWDAKTAARVARKVIELEERDLDLSLRCCLDDEFPLDEMPNIRQCEEQLKEGKWFVSEERRIKGLEVVMEGAPMDRILLFCDAMSDKEQQGRAGCRTRVMLAEYDVRLQCWRDTEDTGVRIHGNFSTVRRVAESLGGTNTA